MIPPVLAGFECGRVAGGTHDLLETTAHTPGRRMAQHYRIARAHGIAGARDGIPPGRDPLHALELAEARGLGVIYDLDHYWCHDDPEGYGRRLGLAARRVSAAPLWVCPVNEPSVVPHLRAGVSAEEALEVGGRILRALRAVHPEVRTISADPFDHPSQPLLGAEAFRPDVVGINFYPHLIDPKETSVRALMLAASVRAAGRQVLISETSWHDGYPALAERWPGIGSKGGWLRHVLAEVEASGVPCAGVCWYPFIDCPPWDNPAGQRWSHGLIRADLSVDRSLSTAITNGGLVL